MITTRSYNDQIWLDLNSPTKEEVDSLLLTQNISSAVAKDLLSPTPTQYVKEDGDGIYAVLHIPSFKNAPSAGENQEVDFIIKNDTVITARYDSIDALHFFAKKIEVDEILNKGKETFIFFEIIKEIHASMMHELAYMEDWMKEIEKNIFEGQEKEMVFAISNASRNLLNFKRIADHHGDVFNSLAELGAKKFGEEFGFEAKALITEWHRLMKKVTSHIDLITELRETNNSMLTTKQNEIMKNLTTISFTLLPLALVAQIFGLSIAYFPFKDDPNAFWIILSIMAVMMILTFIYTRIKKWM